MDKNLFIIFTSNYGTVVKAIYGLSGAVFRLALAVIVFDILSIFLGKMTLFLNGVFKWNLAGQNCFNVKIHVRFGFNVESNIPSHYAISEILTLKTIIPPCIHIPIEQKKKNTTHSAFTSYFPCKRLSVLSSVMCGYRNVFMPSNARKSRHWISHWSSIAYRSRHASLLI